MAIDEWTPNWPKFDKWLFKNTGTVRLSIQIPIYWTNGKALDISGKEKMSLQKLGVRKKNTDVGSHLEELDIEIMRALQQDARSSYRDIARKLKIAVGTVH